MQAFRSDSIDRLILRIVPSALIVIHGVTRAQEGGVAGFGEFLSSQGLPMGLAIAWLLTIVEIVGGVLLAFGHFPRVLSAWFAIQLAMGIWMVHRHSGWFVVGGGSNGMEYSVLLIACFAAIGLRSR